MYICGSGSFAEEDENDTYNSPCTTQKRSKRSTSFCKIIGRDNSIKNPYADRGLDKFYALLSDLDDKKQKIYTQKGSEDISFVRFVYANDSKKVKPIVVRVKEKINKEEKNSTFVKQLADNSTSAESKNQNPVTQITDEVNESLGAKNGKKKRCLRCKESFKLDNLRRPSLYFPVIIVLILLFLAIYGRSFAIMCTSIGWYLIPSMIGGTSSSAAAAAEETKRKPKRKKEYVKILSEKKIVHSEGPSSPTSVLNNGLRKNYCG